MNISHLVRADFIPLLSEPQIFIFIWTLWLNSDINNNDHVENGEIGPKTTGAAPWNRYIESVEHFCDELNC